ncbi:MAG: SpoIIE family protein phosphatase [Muribaculaceae bacterium]|nr:SpoIIE family protein phosphatase [Muribaculaceae bacterium]
MGIKTSGQIKRTLNANGILMLVLAALILESISLIQYHYAREEITVDLHLRAQSELLAKSLAIQYIMSQVESAVDNHVWDAERLVEWPDSSFGVVRRLVEQNPEITGSALSFAPNYYPQKGYWFESYAVRRDSTQIETMQLGTADHDYTKMDFFLVPMQTDSARWTDPYLDKDGARMMLTTYARPIHDKTGKAVGVLDADLSLDWLKNVLSANFVYPSSYHILISRSGQLMSYPDQDLVMRSTFEDIAKEMKDTTYLSVNRLMMEGKSGNVVVKDNTGEKYHIFYSPVGGETGWSLAVVSSEKEIFGHYNRMRLTLLILSFIALLVLVFIIWRSIRNIGRLEKVTIERERIKSELKVAGEIQKGMLPGNLSLDDSKERIELAGVLEPAKEVGGDIYDYYIKDDYLYFCIGDVSGKGVPASLFMTVTRSLFRTLSSHTRNASKVLQHMNDTLADLNESNMFVTFFLGILDLKTGKLIYSNAGHDAPYIIEDGKITQLVVTPNLPLGVFRNFEFAEQSIYLHRDSILFLYTDGLTEAMNKDKQEFGDQRLMESLKDIIRLNPGITAKSLLNDITQKVKDFVGDAEQSDDLTLLAIIYKNPKTAESKKVLKLKNEISEIENLNAEVEEFCLVNNFSSEFATELKLAVEEAVVNVINYAYGNESGNIEVELSKNGPEIVVRIKDSGKAFDPTKVESPDLEASVEERPIGGLGLFLVTNLTDSVSYSREGDFNILTLIKNGKNKPDTQQ